MEWKGEEVKKEGGKGRGQGWREGEKGWREGKETHENVVEFFPVD